MVSMTKLWAAQKREWPNSVQLAPRHLIEWAMTKPVYQMQRFMSIALTTQHDRVLFYITDPNGGHIGARFGTDGPDYQSGFSIFKVRLVGDKLIDTDTV